MKKELRDRIIAGEIVDTETCRYILKVCQNHEKQWAEIRRLPIEYLGTPAALDGWETVEVLYDS